MARVLKGSHSFTCTPRVHPLTEWTIPAFAFPAEAGTHLPTPQGWKAELALDPCCTHKSVAKFNIDWVHLCHYMGRVGNWRASCSHAINFLIALMGVLIFWIAFDTLLKHRHSQDFVCRGALFCQKSWRLAKTPKNWLLLWLGVHFVSCGGALTHFPCKLGLEKFFFHRPEGAGAPTAPPGYAYVLKLTLSVYILQFR